MKKIIFILTSLFLLTSCGINKKGEINVDTTNTLSQFSNEELFNKTTIPELKREEQISETEKELETINNEILANTGSITIDQIYYKARRLKYLGNTGEALKLYLDNYDTYKSELAYNHNIAKMYEKLEAYSKAIEKYEYIIKVFHRKSYYRDIAMVYKKMGDEINYQKNMDIYKGRDTSSTKEPEIQEVTVGKDGVIKLKAK